MHDAAHRLELGELVEQRRDVGLAAVKDEADILAFAQGEPGTVDRDLGADIAAHGVDRNAYGIDHLNRIWAPHARSAP